MARFKKKKFSAEKPPPEEENNDLPESTEEVPPTETSESTPEPTEEAPPVEKSEEKPDPTEDPVDKSATKKLTDRLFWLSIATFAFEDIADVEEKRWTSIGFMIMLFIGTAIVAKSWKIRIANRKKYVTTGIGSFVFMYLFSWIVSHTLVHAGTSQSMIPGI